MSALLTLAVSPGVTMTAPLQVATYQVAVVAVPFPRRDFQRWLSLKAKLARPDPESGLVRTSTYFSLS